MLNYMTIKKFAEESGYTPDAINTKIRDGVWREGQVFVRAPDNRRLISKEGYEQWVEKKNIPASDAVRKRQSPSGLTTQPLKTHGENTSSLSPRPLT